MSERTIQEEEEYRSYWFRDDLTLEEKERYRILGEKTINHIALLADYGIDDLLLSELQEEYMQLYEKYDELKDEYEEYKDIYEYSEEYIDEIKSEYESKIEELEGEIIELDDDNASEISNDGDEVFSTNMIVILPIISIVVLCNIIAIIYSRIRNTYLR